MVSSRGFRLAGLPLVAAASLIFSLSSGSAKINQAGALMVPATAVPKSCSGAFRYAARVGNSDIVTVSPVQVFAEDRKLAKSRYTGRAMAGFGPEHSPVLSANTMCG